jgi:hypothetical protein
MHSAYWDAVSCRRFRTVFQVRVTAVERLTLHVQPVSQQPGG